MTPREEGAVGRRVEIGTVRRTPRIPGTFDGIRALRSAFLLTLPLTLTLTLSVIQIRAAEAAIGIFEDHRDIGKPSLAGAATHDRATGDYVVSGDRGGLMQLWRMRPDGSDQEAVTKDDFNNWIPHPSPDGRWLVFLSYEKDVSGHPANKNVQLRLMPVGGGPIQVLARLYGGQGTINVPSWSPDSRQLAFVSYAELRL